MANVDVFRKPCPRFACGRRSREGGLWHIKTGRLVSGHAALSKPAPG